MHSCIYEGTVRHRRFAPVAHRFRYPLFLMYLDLSELDEVFCGRWLWSTARPNLAWFRREDHLGDPMVSLDIAVRDLVEARSGRRPCGPVRLLTHLRYFGYVINPVSFYFCFDAHDQRVESIVAEVTNTPWGERHCYLLDESNSAPSNQRGVHRFAHRKEFHVSPFMDMDVSYQWRITDPGEQLTIHIDNRAGVKKPFDATLKLRRQEINSRQLARVLCQYPALTTRIAAAIYLQALKLWWKGAPFYPHPRQQASPQSPAANRLNDVPVPTINRLRAEELLK